MKKLTVEKCLKRVATAIVVFCIIYILFFMAAIVQAQNVTREGNTFIEQRDTTHATMYETDYLYVDKDGTAYPIYLSKNGKAFVIKVSKKSGKKYRKYLPEITKQLQK